MIAKQLINEDVLPLLLTDTVDEALKRMDEYKVWHYPVVDGGTFIGVVIEKELFNLTDLARNLKSEEVHFEDFYVEDTSVALEVLNVVVKQKLSLTPVIDRENHYLGSILPTDLIMFFARNLSVDNPGGVIVLLLSENDYSLTEISNIVESNDAKVLSVLLESNPDSTQLKIIIKVSVLNIGPILKTFDRYGYLVDASYGQDISQEDVKENYDSLMNYLKL
ncbi:MAG: CBS domain-containing protein [Bacteroidales bacterium]|nr:CBS domain-containing protein [Bacteroidales bacterium]